MVQATAERNYRQPLKTGWYRQPQATAGNRRQPLKTGWYRGTLRALLELQYDFGAVFGRISAGFLKDLRSFWSGFGGVG